MSARRRGRCHAWAMSDPDPLTHPIHEMDGRRVSLSDMLLGMRQLGATDLYLQTGAPLKFKKQGTVVCPSPELLTRRALSHAAGCLLAKDDQKALLARGSADAVVVRENVRYRVHFARGHTGLYVTVRIVGASIPEFKTLGLHHRARKWLSDIRQGLVIIAGSTDAGKTVTCMSLLDQINRTQDKVLLTLEDPIEYIMTPSRGVVIQREVGLHVPTFADGVRASLRENVDVVFVGEMRNVDTMDQVMRAGETGHLVLTTMHADDILSAIGRIVGSYPQNDQPRVRQALAATLSGIGYQRLLPRAAKRGATPGSEGRVPAIETLWANTAVRSILRTGDWSKLGSYLGRATGGIGYKECLSVLAGAGAISEDTRQMELQRLQNA